MQDTLLFTLSTYHVLRIESLVKGFFRHHPLLEDDVIDGTIGLKGLLGNLGAGLVTDNRR